METCIRFEILNQHGTQYAVAHAMQWDTEGNHPLNAIGSPISDVQLRGHFSRWRDDAAEVLGFDRPLIHQAYSIDGRAIKAYAKTLARIERKLGEITPSSADGSARRCAMNVLAMAKAIGAKRIVFGSGSSTNYRDMFWRVCELGEGALIIADQIQAELGRMNDAKPVDMFGRSIEMEDAQ